MGIGSHREFIDNALWRYTGLLEVTKHLLSGVLWWSVRRSHLDCVVLRLVIPNRLDVCGDLTVLQLRPANELGPSSTYECTCTYLEDRHRIPHAMVVPHHRHPPFPRNEACPHRVRGPLAGSCRRGLCLGRCAADDGCVECPTSREDGARPERPESEHSEA